MSIRTKVLTALIVVLGLFASVSIYNHFRFRQANARLILVNELFLPFSRLVVQLQTSIYSVSEEMRRYNLSSEHENSDRTFSRMVRDLYPYMVHKRFAALERLLAKQDRDEVKGVVAELSATIASVKEKFDRLSSTTDSAKFNQLFFELKNDLQGISRRVDDECQKISLAAQNEGKESLWSSMGLSILVVGFGLLALMISGRVLQPLPQLISSIKSIADGDFNQNLKLNASSKDEVTLLAREYNRMLAALEARDQKIQAQQTELLQAERLAAVGQLSAEVVHEIRNPLNSMSLNIDWLETELESGAPEIKKTLRSIAREIERLHQITESYLVRARVQVGDKKSTAVNELIQEIIDFSREEDRTRNIAIEAQLCSDEFHARGDRSSLKQAFLNILKNAREAMPRGGKIKIVTRWENNVFQISFADNGHGMNESIRRQTFTPFYTTKSNGTGLGLSLTKNIVEDAHGNILCESEIGKGTTFTIQFPV